MSDETGSTLTFLVSSHGTPLDPLVFELVTPERRQRTPVTAGSTSSTAAAKRGRRGGSERPTQTLELADRIRICCQSGGDALN